MIIERSLFLILIMTVVSDQTTNQFSMLQLQKHFDKQICNCKEQQICFKNQLNIKQLTGFDNLQSPIQKNKLGIETVKTVKTLTKGTYKFPNSQADGQYECYTTVAIPMKKNSTKFEIKGIVLYFHPTLFNRQLVPSNLGVSYLAIIGIYSSVGIAVVFTDYIGMGENQIHPYILFPQQNVQSAMLALEQAQKQLPTYATIPSNLKLFTVGYSEGGAYSLWFNKCANFTTLVCPYTNAKPLNTQFYSLQRSAGLQGAYDLQGVVKPFLTSHVGVLIKNNQFKIENVILTNLVKPGLSSLTLNSFAYYSNIANQLPNITFDKMFLQSFFDMNCSNSLFQQECNIQGNHLNLSKALSKNDLKSLAIINAIYSSAQLKQMNGQKYIAGETSDNSVLAFIQSSILNSQTFNLALRQSGLLGGSGFSPNNQIFIFSFKKDSVVSPLNTNNLYFYYFSSVKIDNKLIQNDNFKVCDAYGLVPENVDHLRGEVFANLFSWSDFKGRI